MRDAVERGEEFIALGTDRDAVASHRKGTVITDRAEIMMVCSQLLSRALASMEASESNLSRLLPRPFA